MIIGIRYCGGCNPRYNRSKEVELLKSKFPNHTYVTTPQVCDIWLLVCGCTKCCASDSDLLYKNKLFRLKSHKDFEDLYTYLLSNSSTKEPDIKKLKVGCKSILKKTISEDDVNKFAILTGDYNKLHMDKEFSAKFLFRKPIVHGMLLSSLISSVMGTDLPGQGTILLDHSSKFIKPAFIDDTITIEVTLSSYDEKFNYYIGELKSVCKNDNGEVLIESISHQMMLKKLFYIENEN